MFRLRLCLPALAGLFALGAVALAAAATSGVIARESTLRERPYPLAPPVSRLSADTEVEVLGRRGYWLEVSVPGEGVSGWMRLINVRYRTDPTAGSAAGRAPPRSGFLSSLSRGAAGLIGGSSSRPQETTTIGVRGLDAQDLAAASPDHSALKKLDQASANPSEAQRFAHAAALRVQQIADGEARR